jgi:Flp pilus assembly protein TadG
MRRPNADNRKRRGSVMIEFAMLLPIFFLFVLFSIDAGRMILVRAQLQDSTQQAARAGAQVAGGGTSSSGPSRTAFFNAVLLAPGITADRVTRFSVVEGSTCSQSQPYVTVETRYRTPLVTPGLGTLIGMLDRSGRGPEGEWSLSAVSTARCEVARP